MLHRPGYRFTIHSPLNRSLSGRPDLVLSKYRTVIFVHGCFWHGHENFPYFCLPKSSIDFWATTILGNQARDIDNENTIPALDWHVVAIWECVLRKKGDLPWLVARPASISHACHPPRQKPPRCPTPRQCPQKGPL